MNLHNNNQTKQFNNQYSLRKKISQGSYGVVFEGEDTVNKSTVAIKVEKKEKTSTLDREIHILTRLQGTQGVPKLFWSGTENNSNVVVIQLLQKDFGAILKEYRKFSLKTVFQIADQLFSIIRRIHNKSVIHRDLKPENLMIDGKNIYIVDFGISKLYRDINLKHIPYKEERSFVGTTRYASVAAHKGQELGRKDDLESLMYILILMQRGTLPWQNVQGTTNKDRQRIIGEKKSKISVQDLCGDLPVEFQKILTYIRGLQFASEPDYEYIIQTLKKSAANLKIVYDDNYEWTSKVDVESVPKAQTLTHIERSMINSERLPSPQVEGITVQEQLLIFAKETIKEQNIIEGWDYVVQIIESGGEGLLVHRSEIKSICQEIYQLLKDILIQSSFEVLAEYAHGNTNEDDNSKFVLKDLKREHYIQLRTLFYAHLNQVSQITNNHQIVKVLFDELDQQNELDGYVNKYFETVNQKLDAVETQMKNNMETYQKHIQDLRSSVDESVVYLQNENKLLKSQLMFAQSRIDELTNTNVVCAVGSLLCFASGVITLNNIQIHTATIQQDRITCAISHQDIYLVGMSNGEIIRIDLEGRRVGTLTYQSEIILLFSYNNYVISSHRDGSLVIWWQEQIIFKEKAQVISAIYSHVNFGNFLVIGDEQGLIQFLYVNEAKQNLSADHIKKMKNNSDPIIDFSHGQQADQLISATQQLICIWNWEMENLLHTIKLDMICISIHFNPNHTLAVLTKCGHLQEYSGTQLVESIFICDRPLKLSHDEIIDKTGKRYPIEQGPICLSNPHLALKSTLDHHQETCVYGLQSINYPYCVSSSDDKTIVIFNLLSNEVLVLKGHQAYVRAIALLQSNKQLISGSYDTTIKIWDVKTGICQNTLTGCTKAVLAIAVLHHTQYHCASGGEDAVIRIWNWKSGMCLFKVEQMKNEIWSLLSVSDLLICGNKDGSLRIIQTADKCTTLQELKPHTAYVNCLLHLTGNLIASGSSDNTIKIIDIHLGSILRTLTGHQNIVWSLASIQNDIIVSSSTEGKLKIWNYKTGACLNSQTVSKSSIYVLLKIPNSRKLLAGTATGEILSWKIVQQK